MSRPIAFVVLLALTPLTMNVGGLPAGLTAAPHPSPAGNAHWVGDGVRQLDEAQLRAPFHALEGSRPHEFKVKLEYRPLIDHLEVLLYFTTDGTDPGPQASSAAMTYAAMDPDGSLVFRQSLGTDRTAHSEGRAEHPFRFYILTRYLGTEYVDAPNGGFYQYAVDSAPPIIGALTLNGANPISLGPSSPLSANVAIADSATGIQARLTIQRQATTLSASLSPTGSSYGAQWTTGTQLPPGVYDARVDAQDALGHATQRLFPGALRLGSSAPVPWPSGAAHTVSDGTTILQEADLRSPIPHGLAALAHQFDVTTAAPIDDESVTVHLRYTTDGSDPTPSSSSRTLTVDADDPQRFRIVLAPSDLGPAASETILRFRYEIQSNYFPSVDDPSPGAPYGYVVDGLPPRIQELRLNDHARAAQPGSESLTLAVRLEDRAPISTAIAEILDSADTVRLTKPFGTDETWWVAKFPNGPGLPDGIYHIRIRAVDEAGNVAQQTFAKVLALGNANPGPIVGDAHYASDSERRLREAELTAASASALDATRTHHIGILVDAGLPASELDVQLHYAMDGTEPTDQTGVPASLVSTADGHHQFEVSLPAAARAPARSESEVRYYFTLESPYFARLRDDNGGRFYRYLDDAQEPRIVSAKINEQDIFAGPPSAPATFRLAYEDLAALRAAHVRLYAEDGTLARTIAMAPRPSPLVGSLPNGFQVSRGAYNLRALLVDEAGNSADVDLGRIVHMGYGPPLPFPEGSARAVRAVATELNDGALADSHAHALPGEVEHSFSVSLQPAQTSESVRVRLRYTTDGTAPTSSDPVQDMIRTSAGTQAALYEATLPSWDLRGDGSEHPIRFRFEVESSLFGGQNDPVTGSWRYTWDASPPRLENARINGQAAARVSATTPVVVVVDAMDASDLEAASAEILDGTSLVRAVALEPYGAQYRALFPGGLGLPDGEYDLRLRAVDRLGHEALPMFLPRALVVDNRPGTITAFQVNGQSIVQVRPDAPLHFEATVSDPDTIDVGAGILDAGGVLLRTLSLAKAAQGRWAGDMPVGLGLPDGEYGIRLRVRDDAGNEHESTLPYAPLVLDGSPPSLVLRRIEYPSNQLAARRGDQVSMYVGAYDQGEIGSLIMEMENAAIAFAREGASSEWAASFTAGDTNGPLLARLTATDRAGNRASIEGTATIDNTPPRLVHAAVRYPGQNQSAVSGERVSLTLSAADDHTAPHRVFIDAQNVNPHLGLVEAFRVPQTQTWETEVLITAVAGTYVLPVVIYDQAGNQGMGAASLTVRAGGPVLSETSLDGKARLVLNTSKPIQFMARSLPSESALDVSATIYDATHAARTHILLESTQDEHVATLDPQLDSGSFRVEFTATDARGRSAETAHLSRMLIIDPDPPVIQSFDIVPQGGTVNEGPRFGEGLRLVAVIEDASLLVVQVRLSLPSGESRVVPMEANGTQFVGLDRIYETGPVSVQLLAKDEAGHSAQATKDVEIVARSGVIPGPVTNLTRLSGLGDARPHFAWAPPQHGGPIHGYAVAVDVAPPLKVIATDSKWRAPNEVAEGTHRIFVRAINQDGNWGPPAELAFNITRTNATNALNQSQVTLQPQTLPGVAKSTHVIVSWTILGSPADIARVKCVELQAAANTAAPETFDPCNTGRTSSALATLPAKHGDSLSLRGRIHLLTGDPLAWVAFGTVTVDAQPPSITRVNLSDPHPTANTTFRILVDVDEDHFQSGAVSVYRDGVPYATVPLTGANRQYAADLHMDRSGNYTTTITVVDQAGQQTTRDGPGFFVQPPAGAKDSGPVKRGNTRPWQVGILTLSLAAVVAAAVLAFVAYRRHQKRRSSRITPTSADGERPRLSSLPDPQDEGLAEPFDVHASAEDRRERGTPMSGSPADSVRLERIEPSDRRRRSHLTNSSRPGADALEIDVDDDPLRTERQQPRRAARGRKVPVDMEPSSKKQPRGALSARSPAPVGPRGRLRMFVEE